ncbi:LuxR C-terminal-related transcriptional regulator [Treponema sp. R80B11-R83G3]
MKQNGLLLPLARLASSLSIFGILLCMHLSFTLAHFLPSDSKYVMYAVYIFYFLGIAIGAFLCPLFLPVPVGKDKPLFSGICFIAFLIAFEFILRSFGFHLWLGSAAIRGIMAIPEGILTTTCYGLFYLTWMKRPVVGGRANRTGKFCSLVLGAALLGSVLACYYSIPPLEKSVAALDPLNGAVSVFKFIKWCMVVLAGVFPVASLFLYRNLVRASAVHGSDVSAADEPANGADKDAVAVPVVKTDLPVILRLIGLASVFTILNGLMDMRALPLYSDKAIYHPNYLIVAVAVPVLGFLAGLSINRFIRRFLFPSIILFLLFSCLPLFENYPYLNTIMSTLISIAHYTAWVVFTTAIVELYSGGFWFYGAATVIFFSVAFAFLSPLIDPFVPDGTEYKVLFIVIAAVLFMLLALRWLFFPKLPRFTAVKRQVPLHVTPVFEMSNLDDIFAQHDLSQREIEVANLLVKEGFGRKEIGERLCIAPGTAKIHISNIYQKFGVKTRAGLMALFVKGE